MVQSLVVTLREGVEAALVVAIILVFLRRTGREALKGAVYRGLALAALLSLALAVAFQALGVDPENEYLEGALLGIGGLFVASMVVWVWRTSRGLKERMEARLGSLVGKEGHRPQELGLFLFTFFMVFREGVETVLFLFALTLGRFQLFDLLGAVLGLSLAILFAVFFIRGSLRLNLSRFFTATGLILFLLAARLLAGSVHEFAEVGAIPMSRGIMRLLGYFVRDSSSMLLLMALIAVPLLLVLWEVGRRPAMAEAPQGVERRRLLAERRHEVVWRGALAAVAALILVAMGSVAVGGSGFYDPAPQAVTATGDVVSVDTASIVSGKLYKYSAIVGDRERRFLVLRQEDGSLTTAWDACQICGEEGYMQEGHHLICKNCNAPIPWNTVGMGGGCNPLPMSSSVAGNKLIISVGQ